MRLQLKDRQGCYAFAASIHINFFFNCKFMSSGDSVTDGSYILNLISPLLAEYTSDTCVHLACLLQCKN